MRRAGKRTYFAVIFAVLLLLIMSMVGGGEDYAHAVTPESSNVLDDLKEIESFNIDDYPAVDDDIYLYVRHIAETSDGELLIYVYQPFAKKYDVKASSINIAREPDDSVKLSFGNYNLTFLNSSGVFYKYKVEDFAVLDSGVRYYNISNILRPFSYMLGDTKPGNDSTISEVENAVGQFWTATTLENGDINYSFIDTQFVKITKKIVGYVDLYGGIGYNFLTGSLSRKDTFRNIVAFSTDWQIDDLVQVELQYTLQPVYYHVCSGALCSEHGSGDVFGVWYGEAVKQDPVVIEAGEKASSSKHGFGGHSYTWDKIQTSAEFIADSNNKKMVFSGGVGADLSSTQWVLSFYNAPFTIKNDWALDYHFDVTGERVSDVIILRLMFESKGVPYNLGVVDNKQTGSNNPIGWTNPDWLGLSGCNGGCNSSKITTWLIVIACVIVVAIVLFIILKLVFSSVGSYIGAKSGMRAERRELVREEKRDRKAQAKIERYQNNLDRKERTRQQKLDYKDELRNQKRKNKQADKDAKKRLKQTEKNKKAGKKK